MPTQFQCGQCGTMIPYGTKQCPGCGRAFQYAAQMKPRAHLENGPKPLQAPQAPEGEVQTVKASPRGGLEGASTSPSSTTRKLWTAVIVLSAVVFFGIIYLIFFTGGSKEGTSEDPTTITQQQTPAYKHVVVNGTNVRLRLGPSLEAGYLVWEDGRQRSVAKGTKLDYAGETDEWYQVKYKGKTFYISKQYSYAE